MEENARARASSETLETTAAAREDKRESLFFFRFRGEGGGDAPARASSETLETTAAAREDKRESLFFHASPVSRL